MTKLASKSTLLTAIGAAVAASAVVYLTLCRPKSNDGKHTEEKESKKNEELLLLQEEQQGLPVKEILLRRDSSSDLNKSSNRKRILSPGNITIVHGSMTGTCQKFAERLLELLPHAQMASTDDFDFWDEFLNEETTEIATLVVLLPTYTDGSWPPCAENLRLGLEELQNDWRIAKFPLKKKLQVAVFGMGSSAYGSGTSKGNMGQPAREAVRAFQKLGAKSIVRLVVGDDSVGNHAEESFVKWSSNLVKRLPSPCECGKQSSATCQESSSNHQQHDSEGEPVEDSDEEDEGEEPDVMDVEDMGEAIESSLEPQNSEPHEMITPSQAKALKKEGYRLIGSHSAVKLCRWTKHQLRGRGGCYKHTFYGITSYQCMEATPSLACANKCTFCWRHHKNPVGKSWVWKTDEPDFIVREAVDMHVKMIKETKGIPGVQMDRWEEAHTVRHCALSLVGEPIMYPRINELLGELHKRHISTYLVTNGQHPTAIDSLIPITQLYVSVDAPTKDSLIAIDRPLFNDAWERLKESLSCLKDKGQRTVARLTVVKGWNTDEISGYAELIALGHVSLVEMKGVTYCGKSDASNLNMTNSPFHHEVVELAKNLKQELEKLRKEDKSIPQYDLACEHVHSCSVLLARVDQFSYFSDGKRKWKTWVDYDKFQELAARHAADESFKFTVEDYLADTPEWALFGAEEEGFDPTDTRHRRKKKYPKYTAFDNEGIPTHDDEGKAIDETERQRLRELMEERIQEMGAMTTVTEFRDGAKRIEDVSLMFRGLVVSR